MGGTDNGPAEWISDGAIQRLREAKGHAAFKVSRADDDVHQTKIAHDQAIAAHAEALSTFSGLEGELAEKTALFHAQRKPAPKSAEPIVERGEGGRVKITDPAALTPGGPHPIAPHLRKVAAESDKPPAPAPAPTNGSEDLAGKNTDYEFGSGKLTEGERKVAEDQADKALGEGSETQRTTFTDKPADVQHSEHHDDHVGDRFDTEGGAMKATGAAERAGMRMREDGSPFEPGA